MPPCAGAAGFDTTNANRAMTTLSYSNDNRVEFLQATCDPTGCQTIVNDEAPFVLRLKFLTLLTTSQRYLLAVSVPVGTNKAIDKNATKQHCCADQDAKGGYPNE